MIIIVINYNYVAFCSDVTNVCGFTRESLIAITTNIEGREYRQDACI